MANPSQSTPRSRQDSGAATVRERLASRWHAANRSLTVAAPLAREAGASVPSADAWPLSVPWSGAVALAAGGGVALAAAFPPLSFAPAAWLALAPLLVACAALPPARAALAGLAFAATLAAGVAWFVPGMLSAYFGLGGAGAAAGALAVVAPQALCIAAYAAWVSWLARRGAAGPLLLAGGWLVCELARARLVPAGAWALLAYSQVQSTPLIQIADLAGPYGIGLLMAAVNALAAAVCAPSLRGRRPLAAAAAVAVAFVLTAEYGHWRLGQSFEDGPSIEVAVVQAGAPPTEPASRAARLERHLELTAAAGDAELVVWPEHAFDGYLEEASPARDAVLRAAGASGADLVLGGPHFEASPTGTRYHNSVYLLRDGRLAARYDKHRLVPFAEEARLEWLLGRSPAAYSPGGGSFVLSGSALRLGALLCFEAMFPELAREAAAAGAEVLLNLSNDTWLGAGAPARQQLEIAMLRAVENRRPLLRAASTGISAVVDPHGRAVAHAEFDSRRVLRATVHASRVRTPYQRWGDALAWLVLAGVAAASLRPSLHRALSFFQRRSS